jgi:hypothetical protein
MSEAAVHCSTPAAMPAGVAGRHFGIEALRAQTTLTRKRLALATASCASEGRTGSVAVVPIVWRTPSSTQGVGKTLAEGSSPVTIRTGMGMPGVARTALFRALMVPKQPPSAMALATAFLPTFTRSVLWRSCGGGLSGACGRPLEALWLARDGGYAVSARWGLRVARSIDALH